MLKAQKGIKTVNTLNSSIELEAENWQKCFNWLIAEEVLAS